MISSQNKKIKSIIFHKNYKNNKIKIINLIIVIIKILLIDPIEAIPNLVVIYVHTLYIIGIL